MFTTCRSERTAYGVRLLCNARTINRVCRKNALFANGFVSSTATLSRETDARPTSYTHKNILKFLNAPVEGCGATTTDKLSAKTRVGFNSAE